VGAFDGGFSLLRLPDGVLACECGMTSTQVKSVSLGRSAKSGAMVDL